MTTVDYLRLAYIEAKKSPDPSNQNGAVIWSNDEYIPDCNRIVGNTTWTPEMLLDRDWKLFHIEHAERNAIYTGIRSGMKIPGSTLYCPWFACGDCARAITLTGVVKVIGHKQRMDTTPERWKASVEAGLKYLRDNNVILEFFDGSIGECEPIIVNGELWQP